MGKNSKHRRSQKIKSQKNRLKEKERILKIRYSKIADIYFDESGNTGTNLLDSTQPIFALGSCDFTEKECQKLLDPLLNRGAHEVKFVNLKRRSSGQEKIIDLLQNSLVTPRRVMFSVFNKKFVIVTKIVDDLIENTVSRFGYDLYQGAGNVALSNLLFCVIPAFCGEEEFDKLLTKYMLMAKLRDEKTINDFYHQVDHLKDICDEKGHELSQEIYLLSSTKNFIEDIFRTLPQDSNNPAIPALFALSRYWSNLYKKGFNVKHDNAKPVEEQQEILKLFSDFRQQSIKFGYGIREFELPLRVKNIDFLDSKDEYRLQLIDVITSSFTYWAKNKLKGENEDLFFKELEKIQFDKYIKNIVWPSDEVTPETLGADRHEFKENPADVVARFLKKARATI
jgi:hypothetical protein